MSHIRILLPLLAVCILLAGCGLASKLEGQWISDDGLQNLEFLTEGTIIIKVVGLPVTGKYSVIDSKHIKVAINGPVGVLAGEQIVKVNIRGKRLVLDLQNGTALTYTRVKR